MAHLSNTFPAAPRPAPPIHRASASPPTRRTSAASPLRRCTFSDKFFKDVQSCGVIDSILAFAQSKQNKELKKTDGAKKVRQGTRRPGHHRRARAVPGTPPRARGRPEQPPAPGTPPRARAAPSTLLETLCRRHPASAATRLRRHLPLPLIASTGAPLLPP